MQDSNWKRVNKDSHCPICGKPDWCTVTKDGMIACCMRVEAEKQAQNGGWIHYLSETPRPFVLSYAPINEQKAEPSVLDKVYSAMLDRLTLSSVHKDELLSNKRGMTMDQIKTNAYRSLPLQGRAQLARDLVQRFGDEMMTKVPGFYLNDNGHFGYYPTLAGACGLLIPIRDLKQHITAFQIKVDREESGLSLSCALDSSKHQLIGADMFVRCTHPDDNETQFSIGRAQGTKHMSTRHTNGKYTWFSSKGKEGGTSSGAPAHVAMPSSKRGSEFTDARSGLTATALSTGSRQ